MGEDKLVFGDEIGANEAARLGRRHAISLQVHLLKRSKRNRNLSLIMKNKKMM